MATPPPPSPVIISKGNGQCKIEQTEEELATWNEVKVALYRSPHGFPGVRVLSESTVTMPPGSNTIEGNGKVGSSEEQVTVDERSRSQGDCDCGKA